MDQEEIDALEQENGLDEERLKIQDIMNDYNKKIKEDKKSGIFMSAMSVLATARYNMFSFEVMYNYMKNGKGDKLYELGVFFFMVLCASLNIGITVVNALSWYNYIKLKKDKKETSDRLWKEYREKQKNLKFKKNS